MSKLSALWGLFRQGQAVTDPKLWKERQIKATVLAGVLLAVVNVVKAFGYEIPIDTETANAIAAGIIAAVNVVFTITTTEKVGVSSGETTAEPPAARAEGLQPEGEAILRSSTERMLP